MNPSGHRKHSASERVMHSTHAIAQRRINRETSLQTRRAQADQLKEEGNAFFLKGSYVEAIAKYNEAAKLAGLRPVIMSNLAAAYLKLEQYELAEWACDCALLFSPSFAKARFRRALARKGQGMNKGAETDLLVVSKHHPDIREAVPELLKVRLQRKQNGDGKRSEPAYDENFPPIDSEEWDPPVESDSEDAKHAGNGRPCKLYNEGGCSTGKKCDLSHAPDDTSVRDDLGRNVCLNFLLDGCKQGPICPYSHTKNYLGQGWWSSPTEVDAAIKLSQSMGDFTTDTHTITTLENASQYGRLKKAKDYRAELESYSFLTPDVLRSRIKDKVQDTAGISHTILPPDGRFVLLLCFQNEEMFDSINEHLLNALKSKVKLIRARNSTQASTYLTAPELFGVIVTDAGIVDRRNSGVVQQLVDYVKDGGSVVFGCLFPSFIKPNDFNGYFRQHFDLDWKYGSYFRATFFKNPENNIVKGNPSLDDSYSMKALHVKGITGPSALYKANETSSTQSLVFRPTPVTNFDESPAVTSHVGSGYVSFLGDVNAEESSTDTILAMLGLLDGPLPPAPPTSKQNNPENTEIPAPTQAVSKKNGKKKQKKKNPPYPSIPSQLSGASTLPGPSLMSPQPSQLSATSSQPSTSMPSPTTSTSDLHYSRPTHDGRYIMQLAFEYDDIVEKMCKSQLNAIRVKMDVRKVTSEARAIELLNSPHLYGVFATDPSLTYPKHSQLLGKLVDYVAGGGRLVFGGTFASFVQYPKVERLFTKFDLTWKAGAYTREDLQSNSDNKLVESNSFLPDKISIKSLFLSDAEVEEKVYVPTSCGYDTLTLSPIVMGSFQKGNVGFIGDVNADSCTTPSLLAMFDLLKPSSSIAKLAPRKFIVVLAHLIDEYETSLFLRLETKGVEIVTDAQLSDERLADLLSSRDILGVLVLDDVYYAWKNQGLSHRVAAYAWSGGTVMFAGDCGAMSSEFEEYMTEQFCLPWRVSKMMVLPVELNEDRPLLKGASGVALPGHIYSEGAFVYDVSPEAAVYTSRPGIGPEKATYVSVAYAGVGQGHVAYFGHEKIGDVDATLMLAMLKL